MKHLVVKRQIVRTNHLAISDSKKWTFCPPEFGLDVAVDGDEGDVVGPDEEVHLGLHHQTGWAAARWRGNGMVGAGVGSVFFLNGSDGDAPGEGEGGGGGGGGVVVAAPLLAPARRRGRRR